MGAIGSWFSLSLSLSLLPLFSLLSCVSGSGLGVDLWVRWGTGSVISFGLVVRLSFGWLSACRVVG